MSEAVALHQSSQPCGCDPGEGWVCAQHAGLPGRGYRLRDDGTRHQELSRPTNPKPGLPTDADRRKQLPIFTGLLMYFPDAMLAVSEVSRIGNEQHNPGEPMHWAREKSTDQLNTALRHMMDHGVGNHHDTDGTYHLAKAIWRLAAELQLTIEREKH